MKRYKIFVSVCSYRDPLLKQTVDSLLYYKSGNHDIIVSIFDQGTEYFEYEHQNNIIYKQIHPRFSNGVGWARHINSLNLSNEDFFYQIDSHLLFDQDWDQFLIDDYFLGVENYQTNKILLSNACHVFSMIDGSPVLHTPPPDQTLHAKYYKWPEGYIMDEYKLLLAHACHGSKIEEGNCIQASHVFAGNMFTHSDFLSNVGICPFMYYHGEEQYITLSAFVSGYKVLHQTSVHSYHLDYTGNYITKHCFEPCISEIRRNELLHISVNYWYKFVSSLSEKTLKEFYLYSGINYIDKSVDDRILTTYENGEMTL